MYVCEIIRKTNSNMSQSEIVHHQQTMASLLEEKNEMVAYYRELTDRLFREYIGKQNEWFAHRTDDTSRALDESIGLFRGVDLERCREVGKLIVEIRECEDEFDALSPSE